MEEVLKVLGSIVAVPIGVLVGHIVGSYTGRLSAERELKKKNKP